MTFMILRDRSVVCHPSVTLTLSGGLRVSLVLGVSCPSSLVVTFGIRESIAEAGAALSTFRAL